jgi:hypothetical protein
MSSLVAVKVFYAKGIRVSMKKKTFKEAMHLIWDNPLFKDYEPMKMVFTSTGKVLFMDKQAFHSYLSGAITMQELIELTECDELYRNKKNFISEGDCIIDAGSLWKATRKTLTLIDEDNDLQETLDLDIFEIVEPEGK